MACMRKLQREVSRNRKKRLNNQHKEAGKYFTLQLVKEELKHHAAAAETEREILAQLKGIREKHAAGQQ